MKTFKIPHMQLHVTHSCNFTCEGCSHYSNHGHSGNIGLDECDEWLYKWSKRLQPEVFTILGGEPTLNKNLTAIVYMVRMVWPDPSTQIDLVSNASFLHMHPNLPEALLNTDTTLAISIHNKKDVSYVNKFKRGYLLAKEWKKELGVDIEFWDCTDNSWIPQYKGFGKNMMPYEDNDQRKSWKACVSKLCVQLHEGKLWKCPSLAYLPMQAKKYNLDPKWDPYLKYEPLEFDCTDEELEKFLNIEDESFCSMCPANIEQSYQKIDPTLPVSYWEKLNL
jgi:hypothetical protein